MPDLIIMVKSTCNILILILLAASMDVCAVNNPAPTFTFSSSYIIEQSEIGQFANDKKPKKDRVKSGKKVTFETFDQSYEKALKFYNNQQFLSAASLFEELYPLSIGTPRADTILFLFAHSYYMNADYNMAAFHFRDYVRRYPMSDRAEEAFYYCISAIYKTCPDYYLDQSNTDYAIEQIKAFIQAYPNNSHIEECNVMLDDLRNKLARKDLEKLKLYYNTDHFEACQITAKNFFNEYSYSPLMPEAVYYLVLNNYEYAKKSVEKKKQERYKACLDACIKMRLNYENSKYFKETDKIEQDVKKQLEKYNNNNQ